MALLKMGTIVEKISGKIGGNVFGYSQNGSYMRGNSWSQQPNTPLQDLQRVKIGIVTQGWRSLTGSEQQEFADQAVNYPYVNRVGETLTYTGYQLFCWMNLNRQVLDLPIITSPPTYTPVVSPNAISFADTSPFAAMLTNSGTVGNSVSVYITNYTSNATSPPESSFRFAKSFVLTAPGENLNVTAEMVAAFGDPISGKYNHFGFRCYDTSSGANNGFEYAQPWKIG